jgi:spermidine synthase
MNYSENTWDEFGVEYTWKNTQHLDTCMTERGTLLEMIYRPQWGIGCYMDNAIQSCEVDEYIYHETLVHPVLASAGSIKRVMIIGGGEGATAREVLKWPVEKVDMFEWDKDVVALFKQKYPQWARGAWNDKRLSVYFDDIFQTIKTAPLNLYDVIIIDLFDPEDANLPQWTELLKHLKKWLTRQGSVVMYSGIRNVLVKKQAYQQLAEIVTHEMPLMQITPYKVFIPSFSGESTFLLVTNPIAEQEFTVVSHITPAVWESYKVFNY